MNKSIKQVFLGVGIVFAAVLMLSSCSLLGPSEEDVVEAWTAIINGMATTTPDMSDDMSTATFTISDYEDSDSGYTVNGTVKSEENDSSKALTMTYDIELTGGKISVFTADLAYDIENKEWISGKITADGKELDILTFSNTPTVGE